MKKIILILFILILTSMILPANDYSSFNLGPSTAFCGRYDPVRMCVASEAGFPGGIAFEFIALSFEYRINKIIGIGGYIPIARPILFGTAFQMLQFLPETLILFHIPILDFLEVVFIQGIGASLHYGPDYQSDQNNRGPSFFAAGPRISLLIGPQFIYKENFLFVIGIKPYFEYLFSEQINGPVIGCEIDFQFKYAFKKQKK